MTFYGWITFLISTISVAALFFWCVYKVLSSSRKKTMMGDNLFDKKRRFPRLFHRKKRK